MRVHGARSRLPWIPGLVLSSAAAACGSLDGEGARPALYVDLLEQEGGGLCRVACEHREARGASPAWLGPLCSRGGVERCDVLAGGSARIRLLADYGAAVQIDPKSLPAAPALTLLLDGLPRPQPAVWRRVVEEGRYFAQTELPLPAVASAGEPARVLEWEIEGAPGFAARSRALRLEGAAVAVRLGHCTGDLPCAASAGRGGVLLEVTLPEHTDAVGPPSVLSVVEGSSRVESRLEPTWSRLGEGAYRRDGGALVARTTLVAPSTPGARWSVELEVPTTFGRLAARSNTVEVSAPAPLELALVQEGQPADFEAPLPARARQEPRAACRRYDVHVSGTGLSAAERVTLTTSAGSLNGAGPRIERPLLGDGRGAAGLVLPAAVSGEAVEVAASVSAAARVVRLPLAPVYPERATFTTVALALPVGAEGSAAAALTGWLHLPEGTTFDAAAGLELRVLAETSSVALPCRLRVPAAQLACDAESGTGGCLLAPLRPQVADNGRFTVPLAPGVCFAGRVMVELRGRSYEGASACLGERAVSPVRTLASAEVHLTAP